MPKTFADSIHEALDAAGAAAARENGEPLRASERIADLAGQRDKARDLADLANREFCAAREALSQVVAERDTARDVADLMRGDARELSEQCNRANQFAASERAARQVAQYALDAASGDRDRAYRLLGACMVMAEKRAEPGIN